MLGWFDRRAQRMAAPVCKRLALLCVLVLGPAPALAQGSEVMLLESEAATSTLQALMEPIKPYVTGGSGAGSTSIITQAGLRNNASASITGAANLSAIAQTGRDNSAAQVIDGSGSALLLLQGGSNNNVLQASLGDRNFQLVGVSGVNNSVAYVQAGNDLAGVLDVTNATNTTVLAIQTPASGRYMMPSGLRGLNNAVVVIGPGRMYVLPTRR